MSASTFGWELTANDVVLVVEDDDDEARLVESMLIEVFGKGVSVARVTSQDEARKYLTSVDVACVLLDPGRPDADGAETVRSIAAWAPGAAIVVLTGSEGALGGAAAIEAGAQDFLVRPHASAETVGRSVRYALIRKRAEQALAQAQQIAHLGSWELDLATNAMTWSQEMYRLLGFDADQSADVSAFVSRIHPDDRNFVAAEMQAAITNQTTFAFDHRLLSPDGTTRWMLAEGNVRQSRGGPPLARGTARDITDQRHAEEALTHQTLHDGLTGIPNRALLMDRLEHALLALPRKGFTLGVIFFDIDNFQGVNDNLGHSAGDQILIAIAKRLAGIVRAGDTLARFGGDEFVVLVEDVIGEADATVVADRILTALAAPLEWSGGKHAVTVSAGVALAAPDLTSAEDLLRDADAAMYYAKARGGARAETFDESMRAKAVGRFNTEVALRRCIAAGDLRLHYQPVVNLRDGGIVGVEALVRWEHATRGLITAEQFISVADETGLIVPLGAWVIGEACRQAKKFQDRRDAWSQLTMSVNVSHVQINHPGFVELVRSAITDAEIDPQFLQLEISESALMKDASATTRVLRSLRSIGVRLTMDDFGTGYSSLSYLKKFPIDTLKIDRSFVAGLSPDSDDALIVSAVINMAGAMRLDVIAEGVETDEQRDQLLELGCVYGQGYYFARPMTAARIEALLDSSPISDGEASRSGADRQRRSAILWTQAAGPRSLRQLVEAIQVLGSDLDLRTALQRIVESARTLVDAQYGALGILDESGTALSDLITVGMDQSLVDEIGSLPKGNGVLGLLISDPRPLRIADLRDHPDSFGFPPNHPPMRTFLGVPIRAGKRVFGDLYLADKKSGQPFTEVDEELVVGFAAAAGVVIEKARLHEQLQGIAVVADQERMARDLHDNVIQGVFGVGLMLKAVGALIPVDPTAAAARIDAAIDELDLTVSHVRSAIYGLQARAHGTSAGFRAEVLALAQSSAAALGFEPTLVFEGPIDACVEGDVAEALAAIITEALSNVAQHAQASRVAVTIAVTSGQAVVRVEDDGVGIPPVDSVVFHAHYGLANMAERAARLNGTFEFRAGADRGSIAECRVPRSV